MILCGSNNEECDRGVGVGVNVAVMSETLQVVGLTEAFGREVRLRKKPMTLGRRSRRSYRKGGSVVEKTHDLVGVGVGVNGTMMSETV